MLCVEARPMLEFFLAGFSPRRASGVRAGLQALLVAACVLLLAATGSGNAGAGRSSSWLVYKTSVTLPDNYRCPDVPKQLDQLRLWPPKRLPSAGSTADDPSWSPDGTKIAFASGDVVCTNGSGVGQDRARIWVVDSTGRNLHPITNSESVDRSPSWSPDGRRIAFARANVYLGTGGIYVVGVDGRGLMRLSREVAISLDWSPNGRFIAFVPGERIAFGEAAADRVVLLDIRSRRVRTFRLSNPYDLAWSPNGRAIAVAGARAISILGTGGKIERRIPVAGPSNLWLNSVTWAPDGRRLAYSSGNTIFAIGLDGGGAKRVATGMAPDWKP
jgi:Tol biopolymer transport system component